MICLGQLRDFKLLFNDVCNIIWTCEVYFSFGAATLTSLTLVNFLQHWAFRISWQIFFVIQGQCCPSSDAYVWFFASKACHRSTILRLKGIDAQVISNYLISADLINIFSWLMLSLHELILDWQIFNLVVLWLRIIFKYWFNFNGGRFYSRFKTLNELSCLNPKWRLEIL